MDWWMLVNFAGGIGLFLLGMKTMTDGLKVAAGETLRSILASATDNRLKGILAGMLITAMVQSSSAVIFAVIGFVNASLMTLVQSVGLIYGASIGTSMTSWIVAAVGFNVNLRAMALPFIAIGMILRITGGNTRRAPLGEAIAGLGLFFLGLDVLKTTFEVLGETVELEAFAGTGVLSLMMFTAIGFMLTTLMQSSSAAMAVTITAAVGGLIPMHAAACFVLGAILGTCTTAAFASLGATAEGRRSAMSHVSLNFFTMALGFAVMPMLLPFAQRLSEATAGPGNVAISLAFFHTMVVILGVIAILPFTGRIVRFLEGRFTREAADEMVPKYLDDNVLETPVMAIDALALEVRRVGKKSRRMLKRVLAEPDRPLDEDSFWQTKREVDALSDAMIRFGGQIGRQGRTDREIENLIYGALRITDYYLDVSERAIDIHKLREQAQIDNPELVADYAHYMIAARAFMRDANPLRGDYSAQRAEQCYQNLEKEYQVLKDKLLRAGTVGNIDATTLSAVLERISTLRRASDQLYKVARYADSLTPQVQQQDDDEDDDETASAAATA